MAAVWPAAASPRTPFPDVGQSPEPGSVRATSPIHTCPSSNARLPDRRPRLGLVDRVARRRERRVAVGSDGHDDHRCRAQRHRARPVDDREAPDAPARLDLVRDRGQDAERHRLERLVLQALHQPPGVPGGLGLLPRCRGARGHPRPPDERHDAAVLVGREAPESAATRSAGNGSRGPRGSAAGRRRLRPARPPLTGGMHAISSPSASVPGSAYEPLTANRSDDRPAPAPEPPRPPPTTRRHRDPPAPEALRVPPSPLHREQPTRMRSDGAAAPGRRSHHQQPAPK
jgi:hypothetical protein